MTIKEIRDNKYSVEGIEVKKYLSFDKKQKMINEIVSASIIDEDGIKSIDYLLKNTITELGLILDYTDIDFQGENSFEVYDELKENGFIDDMIEKIDVYEIDTIYEVVGKELNQIIDQQNSVGVQIGKFMNKVVSLLPDEKGMQKLIKDIPKMFNKLDMEKLDLVKSVVGFNSPNANTKATEPLSEVK